MRNSKVFLIGIIISFSNAFRHPYVVVKNSHLLQLSKQNNLQYLSNNKLSALKCQTDSSYSSLKLTENSTEKDFIQGLFDNPGIRKLLSWGTFGLLCHLLQSFFSVIMGTFVFTLLGNGVVNGFQYIYKKIFKILKWNNDKSEKSLRKFSASLYFVLLGLGLSRLIFYVFPRLNFEFAYFIDILRKDDPYTVISDFAIKIFGTDLMTQVETLLKETSIASQYFQQIQDIDKISLAKRFSKLLKYSTSGFLQKFLLLSRKLLANSTYVLYKFLLSVLFSLMVVWDFPKIAKGVKSLEHSRIDWMYKEIAPKVSAFGTLLTQSFEITAFISLMNSIIITFGYYLLGLPSLGFFSVLTFFASFIPVAGTFIATLPPFVIAITECGLDRGLQLVAMITAVKLVESYLLYPQIYAYRLKLHPLLILSSLAIAEHFAGITGLFFGVPVMMFIVNSVTRKQTDETLVDVGSSNSPQPQFE